MKLLSLVILLNSATAFAENLWLAGDHHIHSQFSPGYDDNVDPPRSGQHTIEKIENLSP